MTIIGVNLHINNALILDISHALQARGAGRLFFTAKQSWLWLSDCLGWVWASWQHRAAVCWQNLILCLQSLGFTVSVLAAPSNSESGKPLPFFFKIFLFKQRNTLRLKNATHGRKLHYTLSSYEEKSSYLVLVKASVIRQQRFLLSWRVI